MNSSDTYKFPGPGQGYGRGTYRRGSCRSCQYCAFTREGWKHLAVEYLKKIYRWCLTSFSNRWGELAAGPCRWVGKGLAEWVEILSMGLGEFFPSHSCWVLNGHFHLPLILANLSVIDIFLRLCLELLFGFVVHPLLSSTSFNLSLSILDAFGWFLNLIQL